MSNMCVCHIEGEWCFYCVMYSPLEDKYREAQTEIARLQAFIQHESEGAIDAVQELERLRMARDYWRKEAKDANLINAELNGECAGYAEENESLVEALRGIVGAIERGALIKQKMSAALDSDIRRAKEALLDATQENNGR
ncbi:hypothetical protein [Brevibacillus reuszeri]|uniref:hypothetical protein n=1 Tax=Brevibacillus reuszeri TaxID=54915 RepID=UPI000CCC0D79|nr:hypothetical protein [Brevibacillus reuszeri]